MNGMILMKRRKNPRKVFWRIWDRMTNSIAYQGKQMNLFSTMSLQKQPRRTSKCCWSTGSNKKIITSSKNHKLRNFSFLIRSDSFPGNSNNSLTILLMRFAMPSKKAIFSSISIWDRTRLKRSRFGWRILRRVCRWRTEEKRQASIDVLLCSWVFIQIYSDNKWK